MTRNETTFLNVDLDLESRASLEPILKAFDRKVVILHSARESRGFVARVELNRFAKDPDRAIRAFCRLLEALPIAARRRWNAARVRDFNVGVQAGMLPFSQEFALSPRTLAAVVRVRGRVVWTIYSPDPDPPKPATDPKS